MNCWHCGSDLIWGGDHDEETDEGSELIVTNLSCHNCDAFVLVYKGVDNNDIKRITKGALFRLWLKRCFRSLR